MNQAASDRHPTNARRSPSREEGVRTSVLGVVAGALACIAAGCGSVRGTNKPLLQEPPSSSQNSPSADSATESGAAKDAATPTTKS